jgi:hypothetical protein
MKSKLFVGLLFCCLAPADSAKLKPLEPLKPLSPDLLKVPEGCNVHDFAVSGENFAFMAVCPGRQAKSPERRLYLSSGASRADQAKNPILIPEALKPDSLHFMGGHLIFFDHTDVSIKSLDLATGHWQVQKAAQQLEFRVFGNGRSLAYLGALAIKFLDRLDPQALERRRQAIGDRALSEELDARLAQAQANGKFDLFLFDENQDLLRPVAEGPSFALPEQNSGDAWRDSLYSIKRIRMSPNGKLAAVFNEHAPGIRIFDHEGHLITELKSPGQGMASPPDSTFRGGTINIQHDVLMADDHVLVVDNPGNTLWALGLDGQVRGRFAMPFPIVELEVSEALYLRGNNHGEFARCKYPIGN